MDLLSCEKNLKIAFFSPISGKNVPELWRIYTPEPEKRDENVLAFVTINISASMAND
jgi:hypothetical protein